MNISESERLTQTFAALADPTRRAILERLRGGEATVMELVKPFALTQPTVSKHLRVLESAGLITRGRDAQRRPCRIDPEGLRSTAAWFLNFQQFWEKSFERLDVLLAEDPAHAATNQSGEEP